MSTYIGKNQGLDFTQYRAGFLQIEIESESRISKNPKSVICRVESMIYWDGSVKVELKIFIDHHFRTQLSLYSKLYSKTKYDIGLSPDEFFCIIKFLY